MYAKSKVLYNRRRIKIIFLGVAILAFLEESRGQQPLCLDRKPPFTQRLELSFCSSYQTNACCTKQDDSTLEDFYGRMKIRTPKDVWTKCSFHAKNFLCLKCSPNALQIHNGEFLEPRYFPGLCFEFCQIFYEDCKDLILPFMGTITNEASVVENARLINAVEMGSSVFCNAVGIWNDQACYQDLAYMSQSMQANTVQTQTKSSSPSTEQATIKAQTSNVELNTAPFVKNVTIQPQTALSSKTSDATSAAISTPDATHMETSVSGPAPSPEQIQNLNVNGCLCLEEIANDLRLPVSLVHANDGSNRMFIAEQYGAVNVFYPNGTKLDDPLIDISSRIGPLPKVSEEGIGDIAFHPDFASNGLFYVLFSTPEKAKGVHHYSNLAEFKISAKDVNKADPDYFRLLLKIPEHGWTHNAEKLLFGVDNYLYIFTGDGGTIPQTAQKLDKYNGKILRIDVGPHTGDSPYWIPPDNPFLEPLPDGTYPLPEIYALGFRNPWRCGEDPGNRLTGYGRGRMICGDVGQHSTEELNLVEKGGNYGWNVKEGTQAHCKTCKLAPTENQHLVEPIFSYSRYTRLGKAVIGGEFYRGCLFPHLNSLYIWGDHYSGRIFRLFENATGGWENSEIEMCESSVCKAPLTETYASKVISFGRDENGEVYLISVGSADPSKKKGHVYRFVDPTFQQDPATCENEFQERTAAVRKYNFMYNSPGSFLDLKTFIDGQSQEEAVLEFASDNNADVEKVSLLATAEETTTNMTSTTTSTTTTTTTAPPPTSVTALNMTTTPVLATTPPETSQSTFTSSVSSLAPAATPTAAPDAPTSTTDKLSVESTTSTGPSIEKLAITESSTEATTESTSTFSSSSYTSSSTSSATETTLATSEVETSLPTKKNSPIIDSIIRRIPPRITKKEQYYHYLLELQKLSKELTQQQRAREEAETIEETKKSATVAKNLDSEDANDMTVETKTEIPNPQSSTLVTSESGPETEDDGKTLVPAADIPTQTGQTSIEELPIDVVNESNFETLITEILNTPITSSIMDEFSVGTTIADDLLSEADLDQLINKFLNESSLDSVISALFGKSDVTGQTATLDIMLGDSNADADSANKPGVQDQTDVADDETIEDILTTFLLNEPHPEAVVTELLNNPSTESLIAALLKEPDVQTIIKDLLGGPDAEKLRAFLLQGSSAAKAEKLITGILKEPRTQNNVPINSPVPGTQTGNVFRWHRAGGRVLNRQQ